MASRGNEVEARGRAPRMSVMTPPMTAGLADALAAMLEAADVAAVLLALPDADERGLISGIKTLAPVVQGKGAALLLDRRADLVARSGADGAQLIGIDAFNEACSTLKPERIAGCGGLTTRHDAMVAAESGADYVMFGEPAADGRRPAFAVVVERVGWWAELFEVPCVGYAATFDEIAPLAQAGADFVAVGDFVFRDTRGPAAAMADAVRRLVVPETV